MKSMDKDPSARSRPKKKKCPSGTWHGTRLVRKTTPWQVKTLPWRLKSMKSKQSSNDKPRTPRLVRRPQLPAVPVSSASTHSPKRQKSGAGKAPGRHKAHPFGQRPCLRDYRRGRLKEVARPNRGESEALERVLRTVHRGEQEDRSLGPLRATRAPYRDRVLCRESALALECLPWSPPWE